MALKAKKTCNKVGCPTLIDSGRFCAKHGEQAKQREYDTKREDPVWQMYQTPLWKKFRDWFLRLNPLCMRVIDGVQCTNIANTVHHRISPRQRRELFTDANNVKAVCKQHHSNSEGDRGDEVYTESDTKLSLE